MNTYTPDTNNLLLQEIGSYTTKALLPDGFWEGELSSSALGGAVAIVALHFYDAEKYTEQIHKALKWLEANINSDGSYGDSPESLGNVSTSLLTYAALNLYRNTYDFVPKIQSKIAAYLNTFSIDVHSTKVSEYILNHYKKDFTFSVPILALCGVCNIPGPEAFNHIPQLPFELSLFPRPIYRFLNLSVVSYAIPALVAVGILIFKRKKSGWILKQIRKASIPFALKRLEKSLPESGGFLEAIPLTAFVTLSLINSGYKNHEVVHKGIEFLLQTQRNDGSWPIDINLSMWVSSLSVKALGNQSDHFLSSEQQENIVQHFLNTQNKIEHPFNGTSPGGWGWTTYSGSVPDGDDTPGAMLALMQLDQSQNTQKAIENGINWLKKLQNNDGGFPTFSKGWGKLPFDQSCNDLTGHSVLALSRSLDFLDQNNKTALKQTDRLLNKAIKYLEKQQDNNGSWLPLWFGNQYEENHLNPVYGTAKIATYLKDCLLNCTLDSIKREKLNLMYSKACLFLLSVQNKDGSWGGNANIAGSIEETALAVSALISKEHQAASEKGLLWLEEYHKQNGLKPAPIGLYFASLWYSEKWYPVTAYLEALVRWENFTKE